MNNEQKAQEFLLFVANNEAELKRNLKKNITYNADLFDDVYSETIIKIYNSIAKNGTEITDYRTYFFTSSKFNYIIRDNQYRKKRDNHIRDFFDDETNQLTNEDEQAREDRRQECITALDEIRSLLSEKYTENDIDLFFSYYTHKLDGRYSYNEVAAEFGTTPTHATLLIKKIKKTINETPSIKALKQAV